LIQDFTIFHHISPYFTEICDDYDDLRFKKDQRGF